MTREYNQSKLNYGGEQLFAGSVLAKNIKDIAEPLTREGETMTVEQIVQQLRHRTVLRPPDRMAVNVGDCVREGSVPGFAIKKGKIGGVFNIKSYIKEYGIKAFEALAVADEVEGLAAAR